MIEELTPQVLMMGLLLVVVAAPPLAFALALLLLSLYRRAVIAAMARPAATSAERITIAVPSRPPRPATPALSDPDLLPSLLRARQRATARVVLGGLAYAATIALALVVAMERLRTPFDFALVTWGAIWPVVPALWLTVPAGGRAALVAALVYLVPLAAMVAFAFAMPVDTTDAAELAANMRAGWSPPELIAAWIVLDAVPTALLLLVLNRWTRAVGPLVLAAASLLLTGFVAALFSLASTRGFAIFTRLAATTKIAPTALFALAALVVLALGCVIAWVVLGRVRKSYAAKRANDRSITLAGVWLIFAAFHSMLFALVGPAWVAVGLLAFVVLSWVLRGFPPTSPAMRAAPPQGLVFLRVFSLGRRTEKLFDALSRDWRHRGSLQLIIGPDLARSTVQPHQMLDFVSGHLAHHFVADTASLRRQIAGCDRAPDRDGVYRINSLFCHADTWQPALAALVGQGDRVLMDLRSFGRSDAGCTAELEHLVHRVPLGRCLWVVDDHTDAEFLAETLRDAWRTMPADSPNTGSTAAAAPLYRFARSWLGTGPLLRRLVAAA
jgi:hypothetical protein